MGGLWIKAAECDYKEYDRKLTEQFIYRLDDEGMLKEILRDVSALEDIRHATSEKVLLRVQKNRSTDCKKRL